MKVGDVSPITVFKCNMAVMHIKSTAAEKKCLMSLITFTLTKIITAMFKSMKLIKIHLDCTALLNFRLIPECSNQELPVASSMAAVKLVVMYFQIKVPPFQVNS